MLKRGFDIVIAKGSVDVRHNVSGDSPRGRLYAGFFFLTVMILVLCAMVFLPGKHGGQSMWESLSISPVGSSDFIVPLSLILLFVVGFGYITVRYLVAAFPSDEALHCDRSMLTISKVPWLDVSNRKWITQSFLVKDVSQMRFAVLATAGGRSTYGIRFLSAGKKQKILSQLEAPEAAEILQALKVLGVDVVSDPKLAKRVEEALSYR